MTNTAKTLYNSMSETPTYVYNGILLLMSLAFVISDWRVYNLSMGIFFMMLALILILFCGRVHLERADKIAFGLPIFFLAVSSILTYFFNDYWLNIRIVLVSSAIFSFFLVTTIFFVRFIIQHKLAGKLLWINNILTVILIVLGIVITLSIYNNDFTLARFAWTFTRQDYQSYIFGGNSDIVRTRSIFSEPAHMGFYLNSIFLANLKYNAKNQMYFLPVITLGIIITLSYSMILIHCLVILIFVLQYIVRQRLKWKWSYLVFILPVIIIIIYFRDFLNETIIDRSINIITGEDGSAYSRIIESWMYVNRSRILFGNGIGHTPPITNNFAYALSEFGLIGFVPFVAFALYLIKKSFLAGTLFVLMNFSKGGYLTPAFWIFTLIILVYTNQTNQAYSNGKEQVNVRHVSNFNQRSDHSTY